GSLATGQGARSRQAREELQVLTRFYEGGLPRYGRATPIGLGAVVDIAMASERGDEERTFVLLPVGAGTELTGPGGDGYMTVITPASPVGKALLGRRAGETIEVAGRGEPVEWTITDVG
ncbi:MAG TPA: GreA/GreB family elongation factor, partial [Myxococcota bacterium]|nr:GreA/GreB family elongation factor [Myxococcota bacterium]